MSRPAGAAGELALADLLRILWRRRLLITIVCGLGLGGAFGLLSVVPRSYVAHALVLIEPGPDGRADSAAIDDQIHLLGSRALLAELARRLPPEPPAVAPAAGVLGLLPQAARALLPRLAAPTPPADAVDAFLAGLAVKRLGRSSVVQVSYRSASAQSAAERANAVVDRYLAERQRRHAEAQRRAVGWLEDRLGEARLRLERAQDALDRARAEAAAAARPAVDPGAERIARLGAELVQAQLERQAREARLGRARGALERGPDATGMAELGPALQQLHILRVETVRREAELAAQFGGRHPRLLDARRDLAELDRRIVEEHRALLRELEGEAAIARRREATLARELERLESSAGDGARTDHELRALTAEVELERRVYAALLERVETAGGAPVGEVAAAALARAVAPAFPDFPDPRVVLTVSLAVSLLVAGLAVYLAELRETGLHGRGEVETELGLPCLALVPRLRHGRGRPAPHDYLVERPQSRFAEALRGVLASLVAERTHGAGRVLLIASALPAEGKTTLALALGRLAALEGLKTLLIDADFRRPMVHATLGAKPLPGFPELLRGELTLADALRQDPRTPLRLLPGNRRVGQPIRLLGEAGAQPLLARLRAEFDLVILDTAPLAAVSDARLLALAADRVLMVARWQSTPRAAVAQALAAMRDLGPGAATLAGVVLNDVDLARQAAAGWADAGVGPARLAGYYAD